MARISSSEKLPMRIDGYVIYPLDDQMVLRKNSGFTTEAVLNSDQYARVRENAAEFGHVSKLCKALRLSLGTVLPKQGNLSVCNGLTKIMRQVLVCDGVSKRGARTLAVAFENTEAKAILKGYDFNPNSLFHSIFKGGFHYDATVLHFESLVFSEAVVFPQGADFVGFRLHRLCFDFELVTHELVSTTWELFARTSSSSGFTLALPKVPELNGVRFVLLELQFYGADGSSFLPCADGSKVVVVID